jgi:hypothetical protein
MIHSMVVYGFADQDRVHRFLDFTYEHGTANQTDGCLIWGGIQAGYNDANATQTLSSYHDSMMLSRNCPGNATFLQEEDLSPSFAHIPNEMRGKVSLHTITAGRVELPDKVSRQAPLHGPATVRRLHGLQEGAQGWWPDGTKRLHTEAFIRLSQIIESQKYTEW